MTPRDKLLLNREKAEAIKLERSRLAAEARDSGLAHAEIALLLDVDRSLVTKLLKEWDAGGIPAPVGEKIHQESPAVRRRAGPHRRPLT